MLAPDGTMRIRVKLFAMLDRQLPPGSQGNEADLEVPEGTTVAAVMERLNLPPGQSYLALLNGCYLEPEERNARRLSADDVLAIWPPVAGGCA